MTISQIAQTLQAEILCNPNTDGLEIHSACGSDLMSDVMAFVDDQVLLLTGLITPQVIRTAHLMDIGSICFVRGKKPTQEMIDMANEVGIDLLATKLPMFVACGELYKAGITHGGMRTI